MGILLKRQPPPDNAGGYFNVRYRLADTLIHIQKVHVAPFDAGSAVYNPGLGGSGEANVLATMNAYVPFVHVFFDSAWDVAVTSLFRISTTDVTLANGIVVPAGVPYRVPMPGFIAHIGTSVDETAGIQGVTQSNFNMYTAGGSRGRLRFVGMGGVIPDTDSYVVSNAAGTDQEKLIAYVTGAATGIRAHDGTKLLSPAHLTLDLVKRDRAKGMRVA